MQLHSLEARVAQVRAARHRSAMRLQQRTGATQLTPGSRVPALRRAQLSTACARQEERTVAMARLMKCQQGMFEARAAKAHGAQGL